MELPWLPFLGSNGACEQLPPGLGSARSNFSRTWAWHSVRRKDMGPSSQYSRILIQGPHNTDHNNVLGGFCEALWMYCRGLNNGQYLLCDTLAILGNM